MPDRVPEKRADDATLAAVVQRLDAIAGQINRLTILLTGGDHPDEGLLVRFALMEERMTKRPCETHAAKLLKVDEIDARMTELEKMITGRFEELERIGKRAAWLVGIACSAFGLIGGTVATAVLHKLMPGIF